MVPCVHVAYNLGDGASPFDDWKEWASNFLNQCTVPDPMDREDRDDED